MSGRAAFICQVDVLAAALSSLMCEDEYLKENVLSSLCVGYLPYMLDVNQLFADCNTKDPGQCGGAV